MTVSGVKNILNSKMNKLDDYKSNSLKTSYFKLKIEKKRNILEKLKKLNPMAKKTHLMCEWFQKVTLIVNLFITQKNQLKVKRLRTS